LGGESPVSPCVGDNQDPPRSAKKKKGVTKNLQNCPKHKKVGDANNKAARGGQKGRENIRFKENVRSKGKTEQRRGYPVRKFS